MRERWSVFICAKRADSADSGIGRRGHFEMVLLDPQMYTKQKVQGSREKPAMNNAAVLGSS